MFAQLFTLWRLPAVALVAMLVATSALAQTPTGTILGGVKDAQGGVVPGATVTATNLGTQYSRSAVTDGAGEYALRLLPIGNYMVVVTHVRLQELLADGHSSSRSDATPGSTRRLSLAPSANRFR